MNTKNLVKITALFFMAFNLISCDNEPIDSAIDLSQDNSTNEGAAAFSVNFDNQTYTGMQLDAVLTGDQILINSFKLPALESFSIAVDGITTGSYLANENYISYSPGIGSPELYYSLNPENEDANTGQITITNINTTSKTLSGTFNFTGYYENSAGVISTKVFTNGVFTNITYTTE